MKYTDLLFRFPMDLYMTREVLEAQETQKILSDAGKDTFVALPDPIDAWEAVFISDIASYRPMFSSGRSKEDIILRGFDKTVIRFRDGQELCCNWSPEEFEHHYNKHVQMLKSTTLKRWVSNLRSLISGK